MYDIQPYSFNQAKKLNVEIKPSTNKKKKIDVFKDNKKLYSIGAIGYKDYPNYIKSNGLKVANERRRLYKQRHIKDGSKINTKGFYANNILW